MRLKHKLKKIFGNYYIGKNPTPLINAYHILKVAFSGIDTTTNEKSFDGFLANLKAILNNFLILNKLDSNGAKEEIYAQATLAQVMKTFFEIYKAQTEKKIYLLIDEKDHFTNNILNRDLDEFKEILRIYLAIF